jgi:hypothetical protein
MAIKIYFNLEESDLDLALSFAKGTTDYDLFGFLDVRVDNNSFFKNYNYPEYNGPMGFSSLGKMGLTIPGNYLGLE